MSNSPLTRSKRTLRTFIGIFLILFTIASALNMGYFMRSINAGLLFVFGHAHYAALVFLLVEGISLVATGYILLPAKRWRYIPYIVMLITILTLVSSIELQAYDITDNDVIRTFVLYYNKVDVNGYYAKNVINTFSVPFGGGIFGYLLAYPLILMTGKIGTIAISTVLIVASIFALILPKLHQQVVEAKDFNKNRAAKIKMDEERIRNTPVPEESIPLPKEKKRRKSRQERLEEKYKYSFIKETDVFAHAKEVGNDEVLQITKSNDITPVTFATIEDDVDTPIRIIRPSSDTGTLEKAQINLFGENDEPATPFKNATPLPSYQEENHTSIEEFERTSASITPNKVEEDDIPALFEIKEERVTHVLQTPQVNQVNETPRPVTENPRPVVETPRPVTENVRPTVVTAPRPAPVVNKKEEVIPPPTVNVQTRTKVEWVPPSTEALATYQTEEQMQQNIDAAREKMEICNQAFLDFNIKAEVVDFVIGPSITRLLIDYPSTGSIKAVDRVKTDISRRLKGVPIRFEETVPETQYSGFEVPNPVKATVSFKEIFEALPDPVKHPTAIGFGKDITGKVISADICEFPHLLVSGTSGSGKSVFVNSIITTLIARTSPTDLKLVLVDPKQIEMTRYKDEPHLLCPVINDAKEAKVMLEKMVELMNQRYSDFSVAECATNIKDYNYWAKENNQPTIPYIIVILDEYADLAYSCKDISYPLVQICAKARACGIHVIVSTQRPSTDVITGTIKANLNTRVSLMAASYVDSMTILDEGGAEALLGNGDMLVKSPLVTRVGLARLQGCYIQPKETMYIVNYLKKNYQPEYLEQFLDLSSKEDVPVNNAYNASAANPVGDSDEEKYQWIKDWALSEDYVSMSKIQRSCGVGFNRAGRIVKRLQDEGILSTESEGSNKGFKVLGGTGRFNDAPDVGSSEQSSGGNNNM